MTEGEPLEIDIEGKRGKPEGVAFLLLETAKVVREVDEEIRLNVNLEIEEADSDG